MATICIKGRGSVMYLKNRDDYDYDNSYYFLSFIDEVTVDDEEVDWEEHIIEDDLLSNLDFEKDNTSLQYIVNEDEYDGQFYFEFYFEDVDDADDYKIIINRTKKSDYLSEQLGYNNGIYMPETITINDEEYISDEPNYRGEYIEKDI